jgi:hypothetical protein
MQPANRAPNTASLTVLMTPSLEKLLVKAADKRGQTAEALAKKVLYEWLLADRGCVRSPLAQGHTLAAQAQWGGAGDVISGAAGREERP